MYFYHLNRELISKKIKLIEISAIVIKRLSRKSFKIFHNRSNWAFLSFFLCSVYKQKMITTTFGHCVDRKQINFCMMQLKLDNTRNARV